MILSVPIKQYIRSPHGRVCLEDSNQLSVKNMILNSHQKIERAKGDNSRKVSEKRLQ